MKPQASDRQKLLERLNIFCGTLGDDDTNVDVQLLGRIEDAIRGLGTPIKVVIAGLGNANHRGLAEFLLGTDLFSGLDTPAKCPVVQVRFGDVPMTRAIFGKRRRSFEGCAIPEAIANGKPNAIGLELANPIVSEIGFTILPDYDGDDNRARYLVDLLQDTELVVWCSDATTPWSPEESHLWFTVSDHLKARSLLVLTGGERLDNANAQKVIDEKRNGVADDFHSTVTLSIAEAKDAAPQGQVTDAKRFVSSGGQGLLKALMTRVQTSQNQLMTQGRQLMSELDKLPLDTQSTDRKSEDESVDLRSSDEVRKFLSDSATACTAALKGCGKEEGFSDLFDEITKLLSGLSNLIQTGLKLETEHELMVGQLDEAKELVGLLSYEDNQIAAQEAADIARQISTDLWMRINPRTASDDTLNLTEFAQGSAAG